ncbi:mannitol dehydrogenase family protein [Chelativorans sp. M5D2P16]|uniref:mannitol dehydrogenase family protein n=1 Tax=Chelativorans sp. M5D2P16 TaxID=3095678 RepID=UPI002ACA9493|nr:mannitol dehydrogenase family protein [Chelativorans sp. M5D2P16]MDZ5700004.1 mannitol dehydrogenase family protein [Chelativorans sp. M5D2P16]
MTGRLNAKTLACLPASLDRPAYDPGAHGAGIVHIGVGAFHRAHQAVYTDAALGAAGGDWRIDGIGLRSTEIADALNPQDGLFTLVERGVAGVTARVIGSIRRVIAAARDGEAPLAALTAPQTRIASLTVTEKAYGIDRARGAVDDRHPAIAADLADPRAPRGALGLLVEALRLRREKGLAPFTVLCCDNLPDNGGLVRAGVTDFAARVDPGLADWIRAHVAFPSTMVDRITPAPTEKTHAEAERLLGVSDMAAVEAEPFSQWVIEDRFSAGRPEWEKGGAIFVADVAPYEAMKLRMLNGSHSMMAYAGFLAGREYVRDVMADEALAHLVRRHLSAAAATLSPLEGIDTDDYALALMDRFANPAIAHEAYQIAMDGTEKLPQRILAPALHALRNGGDLRPFAFAVAAWMRYCIGRLDDGKTYRLRDPREAEIASALARAGGDSQAIAAALTGLPGLFPDELAASGAWTRLVGGILSSMLEKGVSQAVQEEARLSA